MLQMLLKEMSYFSYKPLVFFLSLFIHAAVHIYWPRVFVIISHLTVMKAKQTLLITMTPWELGTEKVRVWCKSVLWDIILFPLLLSCVLLSQRLVKYKGVQLHTVWWKSTEGTCVFHFYDTLYVYSITFQKQHFNFIWLVKHNIQNMKH